VAVPTQIPEIDRKLIYGGLAYGDFIVLAAQTSFGKTALALQIALNSARSGVPVLIFSLEMKGERLFIRNLASVSSVPRRDITPYTFRHHKYQDAVDRIEAAMPQLESVPIYVADKIRTLRRLSSVATDWKLRTCKGRAGLIIVDYMQLVQNRLDRRSREEEVTGISRELKDLASMLDVPVLGLSQFNREPSRSNARPELKDLRESGAIEQDVDLAMFIWSPTKMGEEATRSVNIYCPKQRDGPVGWDEPIDFDAEHQWFRSAQMWRADPPQDWNS
jgi:replicative DNA helicase